MAREVSYSHLSDILLLVREHGSILIKEQTRFDGTDFIKTGEIEIISNDFVKV